MTRIDVPSTRLGFQASFWRRRRGARPVVFPSFYKQLECKFLDLITARTVARSAPGPGFVETGFEPKSGQKPHRLRLSCLSVTVLVNM